MAPIAESFVRIRPDGDRFGTELTGVVSKGSDQAGATGSKRFASAFGKGLKVAAVGIGAGFVLAAGGISKFIGDARESQKVSRLTAAAIKSTGGAAHVTADQVSDLSTALSNKTGVDDEAIQSGSNLLLTFTNVRNEVGKGNKIFDQATLAATNMAAALGTEPKQAALQLGKALNDPIKGVTALTRSGVSFTDQQKAQIKTLVDSGKTLEAQKIILGEVGKEFGGAAAASTDPVAKLQVILGNLSETIGGALLPYVDKAATAIGGFVNGMISGQGAGGQFASTAGTIASAVGKVGTFLATNVVPALQNFAGFITSTVVPAVVKLAQQVGPPLLAAAQAGFGFFRDNVLPILQQVAQFIVGKVVPVIGGLLAHALEGARAAFRNIGAAIDRNRPQLEALLGALRTVAQFIVTKVVPLLGPILTVAFQILGRNISLAIDLISGLVSAFQTAARWAGKLADGVATGVETVKRVVSNLPETVRRALGNVGTALIHAGEELIAGFVHGITSKIGSVKDTLTGLTGNLTKWKGPADRDRTILIPAGRAVIDGFVQGLVERTPKVKDALTKVTGLVQTQMQTAVSKLSDLRSTRQSAVSGLVGGVMGGFLDSLTQTDADGNPVGAVAGAQGFAAQAQRFAVAIAGLVSKGLPASLITAVAAAGPVSGLAAADAILSSDPAAIGAAYGQADTAARQAGKIIADVEVPPAMLKAQQDMVALLGAAVRELQNPGKADTVTLRIDKGGDLIVEYVNKKNKTDERKAGKR